MFSLVNSSGDAIDCDHDLNSDNYKRDLSEIETKFLKFTKDQQIHIVQGLLQHMSHYQHGQIDCYLKPMLQRDFITDLPARGLFQVSEQILTYLDAKSLCAATQVSRSWRHVIREGYLWKKLIEHQVMTDPLWRGLGERMYWINKLRIPGQHIHPKSPRNPIYKSGSDSSGIYSNLNRGGQLMSPGSSNSAMDPYMNGVSEFLDDNSIISGYELMDPDYYRHLFPEIIVNIKRIQKHWLNGKYTLKKIECHSESSKGVYCLQYDDKKIVSGLRDNSIKVWDARTLECVRILTGHVGSVLCLQYDENVIISGSSDSTVRVWSLATWDCVNTIYHHCEAVLHLRFAHSILVTCSKDRSIAVWDMFAANDIRLRRVLVGHRAAVNVVDFDQKNIVSASGDRTIKVWNTQTCEFLHTMNGHRRGIACLQYRNNLVVSGSSDNTIRLWQIDSGTCLRTLEGHEELVRCIRFDSKYIVSGAYDGKIKVWDLVAALNPHSPSNILCLQTLNQHTGRVFRLQFDEFQIVSSSHDDTILIWDFLDANSAQDDADMPLVRSPLVSLDNDDMLGLRDPNLHANNQTMSQTLASEYDTSVHDYGTLQHTMAPDLASLSHRATSLHGHTNHSSSSSNSRRSPINSSLSNHRSTPNSFRQPPIIDHFQFDGSLTIVAPSSDQEELRSGPLRASSPD